MSTPRTKRQFAGASADPSQRQITSFFNARSGAPSSTASEARQPVLPSYVQANLLSVGMRVRKSVPEGYKTEGTSAFKLWTDNTPLSARTAARAPPKASSRELLPFCGINKVGGLASQPEVARDVFDEVPELDSIPELTMSQESNDSMDASYDGSRKRFFDDDEDVDDDRAVTPGALMAGSPGNSRVLAVPRSRTQKAAGLKVFGQENAAKDGDFEEAGFLVYDQDGEIEMTN